MPDIQNKEEAVQIQRFDQMENMVSLNAKPYEQWSSLTDGNPLRELLTGSSEMKERTEFVTKLKDVGDDDITALFDSIGEDYGGGGADELYDKAYGQQDNDELIDSIPSQHELGNEFLRDMGMTTTEDDFAESIKDIPSVGDISDEFAEDMGLNNINQEIGDIGKMPSEFGGDGSLGLNAGKLQFTKGMSDKDTRALQKKVGTKVDGKWGFNSQLALDKHNAGDTKGSRIFASGRYQVIPKTMEGAIKSGYVKSTDRYDEATQEKVMSYLLEKKRPSISGFISGDSKFSINDAVLALAQEWASMPSPVARKGGKIGDSYYGGANKSGTTIDDVKKVLEEAKASGNDSKIRELVAKHESDGKYNAYNQGTRGKKIIRAKSNYDLGNMSIASILNADKNKQDK